MSEPRKRPWWIAYSNATFQWISSESGTIADVDCNSALGENNIEPTEEQKANAHLIAAAPEMYEALMAVRNMTIVEFDGLLVEQVENALKKARGEA